MTRPRFMLDEEYIREPRDLATCKAALNQANGQNLSRAAHRNGPIGFLSASELLRNSSN